MIALYAFRARLAVRTVSLSKDPVGASTDNRTLRSPSDLCKRPFTGLLHPVLPFRCVPVEYLPYRQYVVCSLQYSPIFDPLFSCPLQDDADRGDRQRPRVAKRKSVKDGGSDNAYPNRE